MRSFRLCLFLGASALSGCNLAPPYQPPHFILPASYHGTDGFSVATPEDALDRGPWWELFGDPVLDRLETEASANNPELQAVAQDYVQARDLAGEAESGLFPQLGTQGLLSDNKQSFNRLFRGNPYTPNIESSNEIEATASWEPDLWDEIRNRARAQKNLAQATAAEVASARLSLQAELASDYLALRGLDAEDAVYGRAIGYYRQAVTITRMRLQGDIASGLDLARAQNQLAAAQALQTQDEADRAILQHAIADLLGISASAFSLPPEADGSITMPLIPVSVPDALLQRRPDIAQAERSMAAANVSIGVARAAFYPNGVINTFAGFEDRGFNLLSLPNSLWSVGASLALPLFEGGLRRAELQRAWSAYAQTRDTYRATVLSAFQEVEDALTLTVQLKAEAAEQQQALSAALTAQKLALTLYTGGLSDYLDAVVAQETALTSEIAVVDLRTQRLQAAVQLIRAMGGGWSSQELPSEKQVMPFSPLNLAPGRTPRPAPGSGPLETPASDDLTGASLQAETGVTPGTD
jgi:NodT family efflux transporter outer membrane factor (OMF) lipoprotein